MTDNAGGQRNPRWWRTEGVKTALLVIPVLVLLVATVVSVAWALTRWGASFRHVFGQHVLVILALLPGFAALVNFIIAIRPRSEETARTACSTRGLGRTSTRSS
jgi:hypothetical protein